MYNEEKKGVIWVILSQGPNKFPHLRSSVFLKRVAKNILEELYLL